MLFTPSLGGVNVHTNRDIILPNFSSAHSSETPYCIAFDWLQFTAKITEQFKSTNSNFLFELKCFEDQPHFFEVYTIKNGFSEKCARIMSLIGKNQAGLVSVTLENKFCYQADLPSFVSSLCSELHLEFKNYTRLDVCMDFQRLDYRSLTVQNLMDKIVKQDYILKAKKATSRTADKDDKEPSPELVSHADRKQVSSIRWGKRKSGCSITMYNKSLEMRQKNVKPHIVELWDRAEFTKGFEVYRLEFSSPRKQFALSSFDAEGLEKTYDFTSLDTAGCPVSYFMANYSRHFILAIEKKGERFSRLKEIQLFDFTLPPVVPVRVSEKNTSNNYVKNKIKTIIDDINNYSPVNEVLAENLHTYLELIIKSYDLHSWFNKKYPYFLIKPNRHEKHEDYIRAKYLSALSVSQGAFL